MSIPTAPEAADGEAPKALTDYRSIIHAASGAGCAKCLSHVACKPHEDVPVGAVKLPCEEPIAELPVVAIEVPRVPRVENKCPDRLRSLLPPANFGAVVPGSIYRSSYPLPENFEFLETLGLKSILTLVPEKIPDANVDFMDANGIQHFHVHIPANKETIRVPQCQMTAALSILLDRRNHPILVHCNKGKHRTGCVTGCFRKCQGEQMEAIFDEYHTYADPKARILDECFIEIFDERTVLWSARQHKWRLPSADTPAASPELRSLPLTVVCRQN
ncbi:uncharacterized protein BDZ99DRAFT_33640 [Mytilinidion resinicola]|uniref:diphosphoinositol-polyphosphate diphosphatase n=1 Tax=Mytilinidion resinicola TaxID=574789 RepID=A0A6A6YLJ3_9PEZI|nr:uncharacterized protein BDZ99DRAFT_33640 [Mytilinidion resinicola]KAF2809651.1 hypothetical protein BDZ99DRAFT_33640 [Mytilinidion resinicola]